MIRKLEVDNITGWYIDPINVLVEEKLENFRLHESIFQDRISDVTTFLQAGDWIKYYRSINKLTRRTRILNIKFNFGSHCLQITLENGIQIE